MTIFNVSKKRLEKINNSTTLEFLERAGYELIPNKSITKYDIRTKNDNNRYLGYLQVDREENAVVISFNSECIGQMTDALSLREVCRNSSIPFYYSQPKRELKEEIRSNFGNVNGLIRKL